MFYTKKFFLFIFLSLVILSFSGCGYKPSASYARAEMAGNVFVKLEVNLEDPSNSVLVKDAVTKVLIQKLGSNMVDTQDAADVIMNLKIDRILITALQYDAQGYNQVYKAQVYIKVDYFRKDTQKRKTFTVDGEYDFSVGVGGSITEADRYNAISKASDDAVTEVISRIAVASFQK